MAGDDVLGRLKEAADIFEKLSKNFDFSTQQGQMDALTDATEDMSKLMAIVMKHGDGLEEAMKGADIKTKAMFNNMKSGMAAFKKTTSDVRDTTLKTVTGQRDGLQQNLRLTEKILKSDIASYQMVGKKKEADKARSDLYKVLVRNEQDGANTLLNKSKQVMSVMLQGPGAMAGFGQLGLHGAAMGIGAGRALWKSGETVKGGAFMAGAAMLGVAGAAVAASAETLKTKMAYASMAFGSMTNVAAAAEIANTSYKDVASAAREHKMLEEDFTGVMKSFVEQVPISMKQIMTSGSLHEIGAESARTFGIGLGASYESMAGVMAASYAAQRRFNSLTDLDSVVTSDLIRTKVFNNRMINKGVGSGQALIAAQAAAYSATNTYKTSMATTAAGMNWLTSQTHLLVPPNAAAAGQAWASLVNAAANVPLATQMLANPKAGIGNIISWSMGDVSKRIQQLQGLAGGSLMWKENESDTARAAKVVKFQALSGMDQEMAKRFLSKQFSGEAITSEDFLDAQGQLLEANKAQRETMGGVYTILQSMNELIRTGINDLDLITSKLTGGIGARASHSEGAKD